MRGDIILAAVCVFLALAYMVKSALLLLKLLDETGGDDTYGDCPFLPEEARRNHMEHSRGDNP